MDEDDVLDLGCDVLQSVIDQVILIGKQTRNNAYATLGCELFVLSQQIPAISETTLARQRLLKIFKIIAKACSVGLPTLENLTLCTNPPLRSRGMKPIAFRLWAESAVINFLRAILNRL